MTRPCLHLTVGPSQDLNNNNNEKQPSARVTTMTTMNAEARRITKNPEKLQARKENTTSAIDDNPQPYQKFTFAQFVNLREQGQSQKEGRNEYDTVVCALFL